MPTPWLPCPFCGQSRITLLEASVGGDYAALWCQDCRAMGPEASTASEAETLWQTRVARQEQDHGNASA